jgi:hypothetical protein
MKKLSLKNPQPVTNVPPQTNAQQPNNAAFSGDGEATSNAATNDSSDAGASNDGETYGEGLSANVNPEANNAATQSQKAAPEKGDPTCLG